MRWAVALMLWCGLIGTTAADTPGRFDYYLLSLSWSPQYCATSAKSGDSQCQRPYAFVVHGLWPQHERGYPESCGRGEYLDESLIRRLLPIMPSKALIIHEWKKHGVCSGLSADGYFSTLTKAYRSIRIPDRYQGLDRYLTTTVAAVERDFLSANPALSPDMIALQCSGQYLREVRLCMNRELQPRACGADVRDRCGKSVVLRPTR